jgi:hypothetical protein
LAGYPTSAVFLTFGKKQLQHLERHVSTPVIHKRKRNIKVFLNGIDRFNAARSFFLVVTGRALGDIGPIPASLYLIMGQSMEDNETSPGQTHLKIDRTIEGTLKRRV